MHLYQLRRNIRKMKEGIVHVFIAVYRLVYMNKYMKIYSFPPTNLKVIYGSASTKSCVQHCRKAKISPLLTLNDTEISLN